MAKNKKKEIRRANGEGTVYKMKDGRFGAAVSLGKNEEGKRIRKVITGKSEDAVIEKMEKFLKENELIEPTIESKPEINSKTLVEDFVREFKLESLLDDPDVSSRTYENYEYSLNHFEKYFKGEEIGLVNTGKIKIFFKYMVHDKNSKGEYKYSQVTLKRIEYIVKRMFERACRKKYVLVNPFSDDDYHKPKSKRPQKKVTGLTQEEIQTVYKALQNNKLIFPIFQLMINTGMRTQEVLGLRWENVDINKGIIKVRGAITTEIDYDSNGNKKGSHTKLSTTKRGTGDRNINISDEVVKVLEQWKKEAPEISKTRVKDGDYVFGHSKNAHWTYSGLRTTLNRYLKNNSDDLNRLCLHRVRHTVATMLAENGATGIDIMKMMGHKKYETAMKYVNEVSVKINETNKELIEKCLSEALSIK